MFAVFDSKKKNVAQLIYCLNLPAAYLTSISRI